MSEFKFACPVCGQHITADSATGGTQLECPTCFQKIIVPQAPREGDSKFILAAAQVTKPRPNAFGSSTELGALRRRTSRGSRATLVWTLVLVGAAGAAVWVLRDPIFIQYYGHGSSTANPADMQPLTNPFTSPYPVPTNVNWTMDPGKAAIPENPVAGRINGNGFLCERATLQGGNLFLAQGKASPADLAITIGFFVQEVQALSGKTILIGPNRAPPLPKVVLRWKDERQHPITKDFTGGYTLKLLLGQPANGRIPGRIYLALPDDERSYAAGAFEADLPKQPVAKPAG